MNLNQFKVGIKLVIMMLIPLVSLVFFSVKIITDQRTQITDSSMFHELTDLAVHAGDAVHELQKERGLSSGFLTNKGNKFGSQLAEQRKLTDEMIKEYHAHLSENNDFSDNISIADLVEKTAQMIDKIEQTRIVVDNLKISANKIVGYYSDTIRTLLNTVDLVAKLSTDSEITKQFNAYLSLAESKEKAGIERAVLTAVFSTNEISAEQYTKLGIIANSQEGFLKSFESFSDPEHLAFYKKALSIPATRKVLEMRSRVLNKAFKDEQLNKLLMTIGYGGMIHNFKNYVLRGTPKYLDRIKKNHQAGNKYIADFKALPGVSDSDLKLINDVQYVLGAYFKAGNTVQSMHRRNRSIVAIDKTIKISDGPALKGFSKLLAGNYNIDPVTWVDLSTQRIDAIKKVEDRLAKDLQEGVENILTGAQQAFYIYTIITLLLIILSIVSCYFIAVKTIIKPIKGITKALQELSKGDLTSSFTWDSKDEIGEMGIALNSMSSNLSETIKSIIEASTSLESVSTDLNSVGGLIATNSESTVEKTNSVASAAEEMNVNMNSVASAMEEASSNINTVASANEEMNASIEGIVKDVENAKESTSNAVTRADEVSEYVKTLGRNTEEIGVVTETIASISDKTNLLALNATIEAARAGEAGKGFAVVANEIKELASQTATATTDIGEKLKGIQSSANVAVTDIVEITTLVKGIDKIIATVNETMTQQSGAIREITENVNQVSLGINEINQNVSQTAEAAGLVANEISLVNESANEVSNSSAQLSLRSGELNKMALSLNEKMEYFTV